MLVTITGISEASLRDAIEQSSVSIRHIFLPTLKDEHVSHILQTIFGEEKLSSSIVNATKRLGGVPRFLEYFFRSASKKAGAKTVSDVGDWLRSATGNELMDVVYLTSIFISELLQLNYDVPGEVLDNIFSLSVSERPVGLEQIISPNWTVERAQSRSLLYWRVTSGGLGIIVMPPILLYLIHLNCGRSTGAQIHPLRRPSATMTADDNESLAISALLHKLKAASIVGLEKVDFYRDLLGEPGRPDRPVTVPKCFDYKVLSEQVVKDTFQATRLDVLKMIRDNSASAPIAFINGRSAPFADAFIIFPELTIFIHEKQSTKSRQKNASGWSQKHQLSDSREREGWQLDDRCGFFFLYIRRSGWRNTTRRFSCFFCDNWDNW